MFSCNGVRHLHDDHHLCLQGDGAEFLRPRTAALAASSSRPDRSGSDDCPGQGQRPHHGGVNRHRTVARDAAELLDQVEIIGDPGIEGRAELRTAARRILRQSRDGAAGFGRVAMRRRKIDANRRRKWIVGRRRPGRAAGWSSRRKRGSPPPPPDRPCWRNCRRNRHASGRRPSSDRPRRCHRSHAPGTAPRRLRRPVHDFQRPSRG